jgi:hypothetical protein
MTEMANTYVNAVALVLQEYNKSADPMGLCHSKSTLIWPGRITEEAPIFKEKTPIGSVEYNRIVGRYNSESVNFSVNEQIPVGHVIK